MVSSEPRLDVALVGAVFPVPSVGEELAAAACADLGVVPVLLLHLPPVGDAAAGGAEESLPSLSGVCRKFLSALLAAGVSAFAWDYIVPVAVHPHRVPAQSRYLGNTGEAVAVFPQSLYPLSFIICHCNVLP